MNHWPECINILSGTEVCSYEVYGVINDHALRGHNFIQVYIAKPFKNRFHPKVWMH